MNFLRELASEMGYKGESYSRDGLVNYINIVRYYGRHPTASISQLYPKKAAQRKQKGKGKINSKKYLY